MMMKFISVVERGRRVPMKKILREKQGFTLIELMTVVIIVGILAAVAVPLYRGQVKKAIASEGAALVGSVRTAERIYYAEHDNYNATKDDLNIETFDNKYFDWEDVELTPGDDTFTAIATGRTGSDAEGISVTIDQDGDITYSGL
jgi:prepilin-type N-terminal cleavage/methylation domain-containing protein